MNTARRPRRRPRVVSVNFRAFYWLVAYEAGFRVLGAWWRLHRTEPLTRRDYLEVWPRSWRSRAGKILRHEPTLRDLP